MKAFYSKTYFFWLITRVIFMIAGAVSIVMAFSMALDKVDLLIDGASVCYLGLMLYNTVIEVQNKTRRPAVKYIVGTISILIAISIYIISTIHKLDNILLLAFFVIWLAFLGVFDLTIMNRYEDDLEAV